MKIRKRLYLDDIYICENKMYELTYVYDTNPEIMAGRVKEFVNGLIYFDCSTEYHSCIRKLYPCSIKKIKEI